MNISSLTTPNTSSIFVRLKVPFVLCLVATFFIGCHSGIRTESWDYEIALEDETPQGFLRFKDKEGIQQVSLVSFDWGTMILKDVSLSSEELSGNFELFGKEAILDGVFKENSFSGRISLNDGEFSITAQRQSEEPITIDRSNVTYVLKEADLLESEKNIDHAGIIAGADRESFKRGERIYGSNCINCHGNQDVEGSIPLSTKFWKQELKTGNDAYSMYRTITMGSGSMPPQPVLTPQEKYDVIGYIRHEFIQENKNVQLIASTPGYLTNLPLGTSRGPKTKPYQPWADMDYGNFFINTYELVDEETGPERYHSPGPTPYPDEDYLKNNFAYKGIAVRLDEGKGGVSKGKAWMIFDHDLMRMAGGWTGDGFIDWDGILLNDKHETYPRTVGKLHFETPVGPGWANPKTGAFDDPRFRARDGRQFGPLPTEWTDYKGIYHYNDNVVISYSVGRSAILEKLGVEKSENQTVFTRTLNISPSSDILKMKIAPISNVVRLIGEGATLIEEDGFTMMLVDGSVPTQVKLFIADKTNAKLTDYVKTSSSPELLDKYTKGGGASHFPERMKSLITNGKEEGMFAVDQLTPPFENPWKCRMKLSGIDFLKDSNKAVVCSTDGDVWLIAGLTDGSSELTWQRIGSGLFQPLGIKVIDDNIYVTCRDQIVLLRDLDGDMETDFYESFNHDHQVTDHFHEFAMGLQADSEGNLYYAKSGRHAREALIPQHGTLLKVSKDGSKTDIIATGFRAANGVCINPDGSFLVTDQQGYWNPMNRINWVDGKGKFYGNMWGYAPPKDTTRLAMEQPMVWLDMQFDRSPSELLWVDSEKWGALNGSLLSFSYGYGKMQLVLHEKVKNQMQGGVIDMPDIKFLTGIMRGRFNPHDEQLYACGMSAWGTNQMLRGGGLYRIRYTGKPMTLPVGLATSKEGVELEFPEALDAESAQDIAKFQIKTWNLVRSKAYGSDRFDERQLSISKSELSANGKILKLYVNDIQAVDVMTITYDLKDQLNNEVKGTIQNTIHILKDDSQTVY